MCSLLDNVDSDLLCPPSFLALPPSLTLSLSAPLRLIKPTPPPPPSEILPQNRHKQDAGSAGSQGLFLCLSTQVLFVAFVLRFLLKHFTAGLVCLYMFVCLWESWTHIKGKKIIAGSFQHIGAELHFLLSVLQELKLISGIHRQTVYVREMKQAALRQRIQTFCILLVKSIFAWMHFEDCECPCFKRWKTG